MLHLPISPRLKPWATILGSGNELLSVITEYITLCPMATYLDSNILRAVTSEMEVTALKKSRTKFDLSVNYLVYFESYW